MTSELLPDTTTGDAYERMRALGDRLDELCGRIGDADEHHELHRLEPLLRERATILDGLADLADTGGVTALAIAVDLARAYDTDRADQIAQYLVPADEHRIHARSHTYASRETERQ